MRIACVHVPQFALQCLGRLDPSLRGAAVAVVGAGFDPAAGVRPSLALHSPIVLACSRAAWTLGVRLGMTANAARFVSSELRVVACDPQLEREAVRAIADALLGVSAVVDTGGRVGAGGAHLAMYCEVPSKTRGTTFGDRLLDLLDTLGLAVRIGIADDRFTAWVAAAHGVAEAVPRGSGDVPRDGARTGVSHVVSHRRDLGTTPAGRAAAGPRSAPSATRAGASSASDGSVTVAGVPSAARRTAAAPRSERGVVIVPRGGSAAFLAPRPLSLLAITPEVQHMLEALGVRTLGEFAALPAPSVSRPLEADYQALARGESGGTLRPYVPEAPIREEIVVGQASRLFGGADAVSTLAERLAARLRGRARGASRLEVAVGTAGEAGDERVTLVDVDQANPPARTRDELVGLIAPVIGERVGASTRLRVLVTGEALAGPAGASSTAARRAGGAEEAGAAGASTERLVGPAAQAGPAESAEADHAGRAAQAGPAESAEADHAESAEADHAERTETDLAERGQAGSFDPSDEVGDAGDAGPIGQGPWPPGAPSLRGREPHRRTRRARRGRTVTLGQSQLFATIERAGDRAGDRTADRPGDRAPDRSGDRSGSSSG
jgi:hypothetical protein